MTTLTRTQTSVAQRWVNTARRPQFLQRLERVNRRACKLGCAPLAFAEGPTRMVKVYDESGLRWTGRWQEQVWTTVFGIAPKLPGWTLLGVIDHRGELPIVREVPGRAITPEQRERGAACDHCGKTRKRTDTFVLLADDGHVAQVGRNCLADFLGTLSDDPAQVLTFWESAMRITEDEDWSAGGVELLYDVHACVAHSLAAVDVFGYRKASDADATRNLVQEIMDGGWSSSEKGRLEFQAMLEKLAPHYGESQQAEVDAALAWAREQKSETSNYLYNLSAIASSQATTSRNLGILVSLIVSYRKAMGFAEERTARTAPYADSEYVGELKERLTLELTMSEQPRAFSTLYGESYLCKFTNGKNLFVWWASADPCRKGWQVGVPRLVKATVKNHEEYKGTKQTMLTRVTPQ